MRVETIRMVGFRRFVDLTIAGLPANAPLVVLVGPNGCGKSCVFDAFEQICTQRKQNWTSEADYHERAGGQQPEITLLTHQGATYHRFDGNASPTLAYIRSSYRYAPDINISSLQQLPSVEGDSDRPRTMKDLDSRLQTNYQRLIVAPLADLFAQRVEKVLGKDIREKYTSAIDEVLQDLLGMHLTDIGDPLVPGKGQLFFGKGDQTRIAYKNLSSGEKEIVDLVIDLALKAPTYQDSLICVDEPELHIHTSVQKRLVHALMKMIPSASQLWLATHSLGIMQAAVAWPDAAIIDFSEYDYDGPVILRPLERTKASYRAVFKVALEDTVDLVLSSHLVFCEGEDPESDQALYEKIFHDLVDVEFVSAGNKPVTKLAAARYLNAVARGLTPKTAVALVDRDGLNDEEVTGYRESEGLVVLGRYSIENYLLDPEVVEVVCDVAFDLDEYKQMMTNLVIGKKAAVEGKIRGSREHQYRNQSAPELLNRHPLLNGALSMTTGNWDEWYKYVPAKLLVGGALQWASDGRCSLLRRGQSSSADFLDLLASRILPSMAVYRELRSLVLGVAST